MDEILQAFESELQRGFRALLAERLGELRERFRAESWVALGHLVSEPWESRAREEARTLVARSGVTRDIRVEATGGSPRRLRNVRRSEIARDGALLPCLYHARATRALITAIAGCEVALCPYEPEQFVLGALSRAGDTHGWHWDDYGLALVWVLDAPEPGAGGEIECLPGVAWDKERPRVEEHLAAGRVRRRRLESGEAYLLRSDTTLHRVTPLVCQTRRIACAMAYALPGDLARPTTHETTETLFALSNAVKGGGGGA